MANIIKEKISVKVAVLVNVFLAAVLAVGAYYMIIQQSQSLEKQMLEKGKMESIIGAKAIGKIFDEAIDNGVFTLNDALDRNYVKIRVLNRRNTIPNTIPTAIRPSLPSRTKY